MIIQVEHMKPKEVFELGADLSEGNEYITETAGFIPLEVKMRQFEQNGIIAQFMSSDFDSNDYRDIYLNPDFSITPEDELEDIQEKLQARNEYIEQLKKAKSNGQTTPATSEKAGTDEPEKKSDSQEDKKE